MTKLRFSTLLILTVFGCLFASPVQADVDLQKAIRAIRDVGPHGGQVAPAALAWRRVAASDVRELCEILEGMDGANSLARNWLRSALDDLLARARKDPTSFPRKSLETFVRDRHHDPQARRLAYELLVELDKTVPERFLPDMLDDTDRDLRRDAVERVFEQAEKIAATGKNSDAVPLFRKAFMAAREKEQIDKTLHRLRALGEKIDLAKHLGLVVDWKLIGPFANAEQKGMSVVYPPEQGIDLKAQYQGKAGKVSWQDYYSTNEYGLVDFNKGVGKHQEVVAYACTNFTSDTDQDAEIRIGCYTAFKVWLNREIVLERGDAYTGMNLDHYVAKVRLRKGKNVLLLKVAQDVPPPQVPALWQFQLRICDAGGAAILSTTRPDGPPNENPKGGNG
jgi:hypothetical protein